MSPYTHVFCFSVLISLAYTRPSCPFDTDCMYYPDVRYGCIWGCGYNYRPSDYVLACPASRTAVNCGMLPEAQSCTADDDCYYGQKCCADGCFEERICKPGFYTKAKAKPRSTTPSSIEEVETE